MPYMYCYSRYHVPEQEEYESLSELFRRAWADMEYENACPVRVTVDDKVLIEGEALLDLIWDDAPESASAPSFDTYFDDAAKRYISASWHQCTSPIK